MTILPETKEVVNKETFTFSLNKVKLRKVMKKEGKYLPRSNWQLLIWIFYILLMNREILKLAIPNIISNLSVPLLSLVDVALMGHLDSAEYILTLGFGVMIFNFIWTQRIPRRINLSESKWYR